MADRRTWTRRSVLGGIAGATGVGAAALSGDGEGNLTGGAMSLQESFQVAERWWIGPDSAKADIPAQSGRVYDAVDTQVRYYGDSGNWQLLGVGSEAQPVSNIHSESVNTEDTQTDYLRTRNRVTLQDDVRRRFDFQGELLASFENDADWSANSGTIEFDTEDHYMGTQSMVLSATNETVYVAHSFPSRDVSDYTPVIAAKLVESVSGGDDVGLDIRVFLTDGAENHQRWTRNLNPQRNTDGWFMFDLSFREEDDGFDPTDVQKVYIYSPSRDSVEFKVDNLRLVEKPSTGYVIVGFDDQWEADIEAFKTFSSYGVPTYYAINGSGIGTDPGHAPERKLTLEELEWMYDHGAELVNHGLEHRDVYEVSNEDFEKDVRLGKEWLGDHGFHRGKDIHIWPVGGYTSDTVDIVDKYANLNNSDGTAHANFATFPLNYTGPLWLPRIEIDDGTAQAETAIERAANHNMVCSIFGHTHNTNQSDWETIAQKIVSEDVVPITLTDLMEYNNQIHGWTP